MITTDEAVIATVGSLNGNKELLQKFEERENARHLALVSISSSLNEEAKQKIREGMTFRLVDAKGRKKERSFDERGQEYAVDSHGSVKRGHGLSSKDQPKVQAAMDVIVKLTQTAIGKKLPNGDPVYDPRPIMRDGKPIESEEQAEQRFCREIELDIFTPLVREGLLPETFVLDQFSEVATLLKNTFASYRGSLKDAQSEKSLQTAKTDMDFYGAGTKLERLKAIGDKAGQKVAQLKSSIGISDDMERRAGIGVEVLKMGKSFSEAFGSLKGWVPEDGKVGALEEADKFLNPQKYASGLSGDRLKKFQESTDSDEMRSLLAKQEKEEDLIKTFKKIPYFKKNPEAAGKALAAALEKLDNDPLSYTKQGSSLFSDLLQEGIGIGVNSKDLHDVSVQVNTAVTARAMEKATGAAVLSIDGEISKAVANINKAVAVGFENAFSVAAADTAREAIDKEEDRGVHIVTAMGNGFEKAFEKAAPKHLKSQFKAAGTAIKQNFLAKGLGAPLTEALGQRDLSDAYGPVIKAANDSLPSGLTDSFALLLNDLQTARAVTSSSLDLDGEEKLNELGQSEEEMREYERTLVLIDEGGVSAAEQRSIEVLIAQLKKDKQVLELVEKIGSTLTGGAESAMGIAGSATTKVTDVIVGEVAGALKAAKLIMQLSINTIKGARRWAIYKAFETDLERSKIAVSSLSSTIQGFYNNKKEQITFRRIENVLMVVELAATFVGTVPTPYTIAIGKTMSAVTAAAQQAAKVSEMIYNEGMLTEAWATTKAAMDSPGDRSLGLAALRLNPTLGMHALAWAGMEKQPPDPIARLVLDSLGLDEQTLAVSGSEKKVREYLEELLDEDRKLLDPSKINANWIPPKLTLNAKDWYIVSSRGSRDAHPPLRQNDGQAVFTVLKPLDQHDLKALRTGAQKGAIAEDEMEKFVKEINDVCEALGKYNPSAQDNTPHTEMAGVVAEFLKLASEHRNQLKQVAELNKEKRDPVRAAKLLEGHIELFEKVLQSDEEMKQVLVAAFKGLRVGVGNDLTELKSVKIFESDTSLKSKVEQLEQLLDFADQTIENAEKNNLSTLLEA